MPYRDGKLVFEDELIKKRKKDKTKADRNKKENKNK